MHEMAFARAVLNDINSVRKPNKEVIQIDLELGELVGVHDHDLEDALEDLAGWKYSFKLAKSKVKCSCGYEGPAQIDERLHDAVIFSCPKCSGVPDILEGDKIKILKIKYK